MAEREPSRTRQQESALSSRGPNAESSGADVSKPKRRRPKSESTGAATSEHEPRPRRPRPRKEESAGNDASDPETGIPAKPRRHRPPKEESDPQAAGPPKPRRQRPPKEESPEGAQSAPRPRRKRPNPESNPESEPEPGAHRKRRHRPVPDEPPLTKEPEVTAPPSKQEEKEKSDPAITVRGVVGPRDIITIMFLWTIEILHVTISTCLVKFIKENSIRRFTDEISTRNAEEEGFYIPKKSGGDSWIFIAVTSLIMILMGLFLSLPSSIPIASAIGKYMDQHKYEIMHCGIGVYIFSAILGIMLTITKRVEVVIAMIWFEVSWYAVHPLRFWYIFHQVFPISSRWSHLLVTVNLLIIGIVEYIVTLSIKDRNSEEPFPSSFYPVFFGMLAVVGIVWMICAFFVKRFLNPAPGDLNAVKEVYSKTETIEEFNKKQSIVNFVLFPLVMAPALMFPIADVVMDISHNYLPLNSVNLTIGFVPYRPHLVCFLLVLIIAEVLHQLLKFFGSELFNLVMLVISHALVLTALLLITLIIYDTWIIRTRTPSPGDGFAIIVTPYVPSYHVQIGEKITRRTLTFHVVEDLPDDGRIPIRVADKDTGEVYKEDHIVIREAKKSTTDFYHVVNNSIAKRVEIIKIPMKRITHGNYRRFIFMNNAAECSNYRRPELLPKMYPNVKPRGMWINNECLPMVFKFYAEGSDAKKATPFAPPAHNESLDVVVHCIDGYQGVPIRDIKGRLTATCHDTMTLAYYRLLSYLIQTGIIPKPPDPFFPFYPIYHDAEVYPYSITLIISEDISFLNASRRSPRPHYIEVGYPQGVGEHQMLLAECLYGTALALASVAYIHFLWMECPIRFRMLFIFGFFALIFAASSITKRHLTHVNENNMNVLILTSGICFSGQVVACVLFCIRILLKRSKRPDRGWRRH